MRGRERTVVRSLVVALASVAVPLLLWGCGKTGLDDDLGAGGNGTDRDAGSSIGGFLGGGGGGDGDRSLGRPRAKDAQFLIQATFGPTQESLAELSKTTYLDWIRRQMALPVESHRAFFRQRSLAKIHEVVQTGAPRDRCSKGSRWTRYAIRSKDVVGPGVIEVKNNEIYVDGELRTAIDPSYTKNLLRRPSSCTDVVPQGRPNCIKALRDGCREMYPEYCRQTCWDQGQGLPGEDCSSGWPELSRSNFKGQICLADDAVGGTVAVVPTGGSCNMFNSDGVKHLPNPAIYLTNAGQAADASSMTFVDGMPGVKALARAGSCPIAGYRFIRFAGNPTPFYMADDRQALVQNTLAEPAVEPDAPVCMNVPVTFLNVGKCKVSPSCQPAGEAGDSFQIRLDVAARQLFFTAARKFVYEVRNLRATEDPCGKVSRWVECSSCSESSLSSAAKSAIASKLSAASGRTRDITASCSGVPAGAVVAAGGKKFQHAHRNENDVFDFTAWAEQHPGGMVKIEQWARGEFVLSFPRSHDMSRWIENSGGRYISRVGTSGERVGYSSLPSNLQTNGLKSAFGQSAASPFFAACGSPNEVSNDARYGHRFDFFIGQRRNTLLYDGSEDHLNPKFYEQSHHHDSKGRVWMMHALYAKDQLRQRVVWALAQTFVVSTDAGHGGNTELWLNYYDILLRHAFGNLRDLLREVTFSPIMGDFLTYMRSRAFDITGYHPDENYAREIMQLFTIGLVMLNDDGTTQKDAAGQEIPTYSNDNIMEFARVFTGLEDQAERSNFELNKDFKNPYDPMRMNWNRKDMWPKRDLYGGYLGDGVPHCAEIPKGEFLRRGAVFEHAGPDVGDGGVLVLRSSSPLYRFLCSPDSAGRCSYEMVRELPQDLRCDGGECEQTAFKLRYVKVGSAHYLYKPAACVNRYFNEGSVNVEFTFDGGITGQLGPRWPKISFSAAWSTPVPTPAQCRSPCTNSGETCTCPGTSSMKSVFSSFPVSRQQDDVTKKFTMGDYKPTGSPVKSRSGINAYHPSGRETYDTSTVFEIGGKFYRNAEAVVDLRGPGNSRFSFRNPVAFIRGSSTTHREKVCADEVEGLLDHLFEHQNTAPFLAYRLIQRLVSSNPTRAHMQAVTRAFRTGYAQGARFSGKYGDIGAAVAATLLHSDARSSASPTAGALREPMLKVAHYLRSMEYDSDWRSMGEVLKIRNLKDQLAQWPFEAPSVFSFFSPSYRPTGFDARRVPESLVGPEFEIFTAPNAINLINGLSGVIQDGEISSCSKWGNTRGCFQGRFYFRLNESSMGGSALETLDVLLTGGRLSPRSKAIVQAAHSEAPPGEKLKAAQRAVILTPEFNAMGEPLPSGERPPAPAPAPRAPRSYKAFVMLYLHGGADTWNMLVPMGCGLYDEYRSVRGIAALSPGELLGIRTEGQPCQNFGIHNALPDLQALYNSDEAAFVTNVGALVKPVTRYDYKERNVTLCKGLFSHSDQTTAASTLQCQVAGSAPGGVGGRIADELAKAGLKTFSYSVNGKKLWPQGRETNPTIVSSRGTPRLKDYANTGPVVANISRGMYQNIYLEEYARELGDAVESSEDFGKLLESATLSTAAAKSPQGGLAQQLAVVAKLIATRRQRGAERDIFFVSAGGWDMHRELTESLKTQFGNVNGAIKMFAAEMKAQGAWDSVVVSTSSDFARTLTSNGRGTDHAWAGNHVVLGGGVRGRRVYNSFPRQLKKDGEQDVGRGRLVPKYPWESMMVPIASWMGVPEASMDRAFPNRRNFQPQHIIPQGQLFK